MYYVLGTVLHALRPSLHPILTMTYGYKCGYAQFRHEKTEVSHFKHLDQDHITISWATEISAPVKSDSRVCFSITPWIMDFIIIYVMVKREWVSKYLREERCINWTKWCCYCLPHTRLIIIKLYYSHTKFCGFGRQVNLVGRAIISLIPFGSWWNQSIISVVYPQVAYDGTRIRTGLYSILLIASF